MARKKAGDGSPPKKKSKDKDKEAEKSPEKRQSPRKAKAPAATATAAKPKKVPKKAPKKTVPVQEESEHEDELQEDDIIGAGTSQGIPDLPGSDDDDDVGDDGGRGRWSAQMERAEEIIADFYRDRPKFYDHGDEDYKKKSTKERELQQLADQLNAIPKCYYPEKTKEAWTRKCYIFPFPNYYHAISMF